MTVRVEASLFLRLLWLSFGHTALEFINHSSSIERFLGSSIKGVAIAANFNGELIFSRTHGKSIPARAGYCSLFVICWMGFNFHSADTISDDSNLCKLVPAQRINHINLNIISFNHNLITVEFISWSSSIT